MVHKKSNDMHAASTAVYDRDKLNAALDALMPSQRHTKAEKFREHYRAIEAALSRKMSQKAILAALKQHGLCLSPATFKSMLSRARKAAEKRSQAANEEAQTFAVDNDEPMIGTISTDDGPDHAYRAKKGPQPVFGII